MNKTILYMVNVINVCVRSCVCVCVHVHADKYMSECMPVGVCVHLCLSVCVSGREGSWINET